MPTSERRVSTDSLLIASVKIISVLTGIIGSAIIARNLRMDDYGTYSQVILISSVVASFTVFGLVDAANVFFNSKKDWKTRSQGVQTVIILQMIISLFIAIILFISRDLIANSFDNPAVSANFLYASLAPCFINLGGILQVIIVSLGGARLIALRNLFFSLLKLVIIWVFSSNDSDLKTLLLLLIILELASLLWFIITAINSGFKPQRPSFSFTLIKEILAFSAPMGVYLAAQALTTQVDKFALARNSTLHEYAIYANATMPLPVDIIATSFLVVLVPVLTRSIAISDKSRARLLYSEFLRLNYVTTGILCGFLFVAAPAFIGILYGERFVEGVPIFRIFIIGAFLRFGATTLIMTAGRKTKELMLIALGSALISFPFVFIVTYFYGTYGAAISSATISLALSICITIASTRFVLTGTQFPVDLTAFLKFLIPLATTACITILFSSLFPLDSTIKSSLLSGILFLAIMLPSNFRRIRRCLTDINLLSKES